MRKFSLFFFPSPLVGEGGAKRRMRGPYPQSETLHPASLREATLSHKGRGCERSAIVLTTMNGRVKSGRNRFPLLPGRDDRY
jgi:hypothetical protein